MKISKRRAEMGEEAWVAYQTERNRRKTISWEKKNVEKVIKSRQNKKKKLVDYKGGKCERCDFKSDIMDVYDFHHKDTSEKEFGLGSGEGKNYSFERCKVEADKCMLVCKNCHAIIHNELVLKKHGLLKQTIFP